MASRQHRTTDLGHWALLGGAATLLLLLSFGLGSPRRWLTRSLQLSFRTSNAAGLVEGMPVKISGYPVGRLQRIDLLDDGQVQITLEVAASRAPLLGSHSRATLAQDGLLSGSYLALHPDPERRGPADRPGSTGTLTYEQSPDITTLIRELAASRVPLQQMLSRAGLLIEGRLPQSLNQLDRTLASGERLAQLLERDVLPISGTFGQRLDRTTDNLEQTLGTLKSTLLEIRGLASSSNALLLDIRRSRLLELLGPADGPEPETR
ncbi:MAG: MlaD family protein [Cyanobacteriota bacterium]|nr:MlaD family protein [Cyanobacteriota bacterium]